ncbi:MAG: SufD family Fe-S cluster assembly protein [Clostridia bacterium]|nr:SufD family Fe-S cluster assembly protein [Clostridia bacterium]
MNINKIPAKTFYWLHMNDAQIDPAAAAAEGVFTAENPNCLTGRTEAASVLDIQTGMGDETARLFDGAAIPVHYFTCAPGTKTADALRFDFMYRDGDSVLNRFEFEIPDNCDITVAMRFSAEKETAATAGIQVKFKIGKASVVRLQQVQTLGGDVEFYNDTGVSCDDGARFELTQVVLDGKHTYIGARTSLEGTASALVSDVGYLVGRDARLDMNYVAYHTGKKTTCDINASGVLSGNAYKLFRGTIDFRNGCAGAVGNEKEDIILMDEDIVNKTIPIILCEEEDVEGNHGATIGRIDEELMFYLESRGIPADAVYDIMAKARINAVAARITDEKTRNAVTAYLGEEPENDE